MEHVGKFRSSFNRRSSFRGSIAPDFEWHVRIVNYLFCHVNFVQYFKSLSNKEAYFLFYSFYIQSGFTSLLYGHCCACFGPLRSTVYEILCYSQQTAHVWDIIYIYTRSSFHSSNSPRVRCQNFLLPFQHFYSLLN